MDNKMINKYEKLASRTCASLSSPELDLSHMMLGMISEMVELDEAIEKNDNINIGEEIADQFWYIANYCRIRQHSFADLMNELGSKTLINNAPGDLINRLTLTYSYWSDLVKKNIAYGKEIPHKDERMTIQVAMFYLLSICNSCNISDINGILHSNIAKLQARFPLKFTKDDALNRDVEIERSILEGK